MVITLSVIVVLVVILLIVWMYISRHGGLKRNTGRNYDDFKTFKHVLTRDNHVFEFIRFKGGYGVFHRFSMESEEVDLIVKAIDHANGMKESLRPTDIIIENGSRGIRLSSRPGYPEQDKHSRPYEFYPIYREGELQRFEVKEAVNYY